MPIITEDLKAAMQGIAPSTLVSCSKEGIPNINYISQVYYVDSDHVALSHQFFSKSIRNIDDNPQVSVNIVNPDDLRIWKLDLLFSHKETEGDLFDQMCYQLEAISSMMGMEGVFRLLSAYVFKVLDIEDIS